MDIKGAKKSIKMILTGGESGPLVTTSEFDVKVSNKSMDVVILLNLQAERGGEGQVLQLHRINVHLLWGRKKKQRENGKGFNDIPQTHGDKTFSVHVINLPL